MIESTLHEAGQAYLDHLKTQGKKERTLYTYSKDFKQIEDYFGKDKKLSSILIPHVAGFLKSDQLLKLASGKERATPTVEKTKRVFRMFLIWAKDTGRIDKLPMPKAMPMGRSAKKKGKTEVMDGQVPSTETAIETIEPAEGTQDAAND